MRRRTESDRLLCAVFTWLMILAMCWPANAQKNLVTSIDYEFELALYRPQIALASDGSHAVAWESYAKLLDTEEWQIGTMTFASTGVPLDEAIYLRDPSSCVPEDIEGYRGVQNADIHFDRDGMLFIAMEPEIGVHNGRLHKRPRTILSKIDPTSHVTFQDSASPCGGVSSESEEGFESERPRFGFTPQSGDLVVVSSSLGVPDGTQKGPFKKISYSDSYSGLGGGGSSFSGASYIEKWHDVAVGNTFAAYTWQRCYVVDHTGGADDCDIVVQFVPHSSEAATIHTTKPIRVNAGDQSGVLNHKPSIAINAEGESVVVWIDYRYSESGDIMAQRFDSTGWPVGDNTRISNGTADIDDAEGLGPEVALKNDGSYMVVWTQDNGEGRKAVGQVVSGSDRREDGPFRLDADAHLESLGADVTSNGTQFAYTWVTIDEYGPAIYYWVSDSESLTTRNFERPGTDFSFTGYPNPFSDETTLEYVLNKEGHVTLVIYDLLGREVKKLIDKWQAPGSYLVNVPAGELAIGYYVTKLQQGDSQFSKVLIRTP